MSQREQLAKFVQSNVTRIAIYQLADRLLVTLPTSRNLGKPPNPGIFQALFSVSLQYGLRLCENDPLFDRKLLDYLYEQGVRSTSDNARILVVFLHKKIHYSEPNSASDYQFSDPSLGFFGSGVPPLKK